jgi:hypothetical protein
MKSVHAQANLNITLRRNSPESIPDAIFSALTFIAFLAFAILLYWGSPV